jgi:hypothetical protein
MPDRKALLVGSLPFPSEEQAMKFAIENLGGMLLGLPDGEIGEVTDEYPKGKRAAWVMTAIDICSADTENWEIIKESGNSVDGFPADYDDVQKLKPKRPPAEMHKHMNFGYHEYFKASYPAFKRLREEHNLPDLKFQVGVPTGLGIAFSMMQPITALRYTDAFNKRIAYEVNEILKIAAEDVIIQIEVPAELKLAYTLPNFLMGWSIRPITGLLDKINAPAKIGVHICLGDLNNIALTEAKTLDKMVKFSNLMVEKWSPEHELVYVHYPLAEAVTPPPTDKAYYQPLRDIHLPNDARFVAGFVHEGNTEEINAKILHIIEDIYGSPVDVACSCGLGRRSNDEAKQLISDMNQTASLA